MLGNLAGVLLILVVIAGAAGLVYGLGYLGYRMNGETGAVTGGFLGCLALYYGGKFVWRNLVKPSIDNFPRITPEQLREMERSGQIVVAKRHKGKLAHHIKFKCSRCGRRNSAVAAMNDLYYLPCMHCHFPHRLFFKSFW